MGKLSFLWEAHTVNMLKAHLRFQVCACMRIHKLHFSSMLLICFFFFLPLSGEEIYREKSIPKPGGMRAHPYPSVYSLSVSKYSTLAVSLWSLILPTQSWCFSRCFHHGLLLHSTSKSKPSWPAPGVEECGLHQMHWPSATFRKRSD